MDRVKAHNKEVTTKARYRAEEMKIWPSPLEERMLLCLDAYGIKYEFQKIFYIYADDGWIERYYISDFYVPDKKLIIEVDGKFHEEHKLHDKMRTKEIQEHYPGIEVMRFNWKEVNDPDTMRKMADRIKSL
jgi:very-short-patch-repair endonuclease